VAVWVLTTTGWLGYAIGNEEVRWARRGYKLQERAPVEDEGSPVPDF